MNEVYNHPCNLYGKYVRVFLGNIQAKEGLSLKGVMNIHLLEPIGGSLTIQAIGRAMRNCSHSGMPTNKWRVKVYMYVSTMNNEETALSNEQIMIQSKSESYKSSEIILNAIRSNSIDSILFADYVDPMNERGLDMGKVNEYLQSKNSCYDTQSMRQVPDVSKVDTNQFETSSWDVLASHVRSRQGHIATNDSFRELCEKLSGTYIENPEFTWRDQLIELYLRDALGQGKDVFEGLRSNPSVMQRANDHAERQKIENPSLFAKLGKKTLATLSTLFNHHPELEDRQFVKSDQGKDPNLSAQIMVYLLSPAYSDYPVNRRTIDLLTSKDQLILVQILLAKLVRYTTNGGPEIKARIKLTLKYAKTLKEFDERKTKMFDENIKLQKHLKNQVRLDKIFE
jgi:hypothetical protein